MEKMTSSPSLFELTGVDFSVAVGLGVEVVAGVNVEVPCCPQAERMIAKMMNATNVMCEKRLSMDEVG